jgi:hypothetical protein
VFVTGGGGESMFKAHMLVAEILIARSCWLVSECPWGKSRDTDIPQLRYSACKG